MERPEMKIAKKSWSEHALIVLVRGKPEEAILDCCKGSSPVGPNGEYGVCKEWANCDVACSACIGT